MAPIERCLVALGILFSAIVVLPGCSKSTTSGVEHVTVAIPAPTISFSPNYIAEARGFWKEQGLDVELKDIAGVQATNAVLAGSVDFANTTGATLIRANARGQKLVAIANTQEHIQVEIVVAKAFAEKMGWNAQAPAVERAKLLKGARIAIDAPSTMLHGYVKYVAKRGGLDPDRDLTVTSVAPPAMFAALKAGEVDGISISRPWSTMARRELGAVTIASNVDGDFPELEPFDYNVIVARPGTCEAKPTVCHKLVAGMEKTLVFMHDHSDETLAILRARFKTLDPSIVEDAHRALLAGTPRSATVEVRGLQNAQQYMLEAGILRPEEQLRSFDAIYRNEIRK